MGQIPDKGTGLSLRLGLTREALFYKNLRSEIPEDLIPKIYYSYGDFATGNKCVIMEDIKDAIDSGILFGPGNPNNWKRDLKSIAAKAGNPPPSSKHVALKTFREIAKVHAAYWKDTKLLSADKTWLRGQEWLQGKSKASWEASQQLIQGMWKSYLDSESDNSVISWDKNVRSTVEKAMKGISWESQMARLHPHGHWTLVHGDFWPGNIMWMTGNEKSDAIKFVDWEMVGLGSGPQELGQYVISNMDPAERKACELELVQAYYGELKQHLPSDKVCSWEYCWQEYRVGGVERWLWFLVYFVGNGMGDWAQFFHNQISDMMNSHGLTAEDFTQPRP